MSSRHLLLSTIAAVAALSAVPAYTAPGAPAQAATSEADRANGVYDFIFKDLVAHNPEVMTALGLDRSASGSWAKGKLADRSEKGEKDSLARSEDWLRRVDAIDRARLSGMDRINLDSVRYQLAVGAEGERRFSYGVRGLPRPFIVSQQNGAYQDIPDLLRSQHRVETVEDAEAYLQRLAAFAVALDHETAQIKRDAAGGVIPPIFVIGRTLGLLEQLRGGEPEKSELVTSLAARASEAKIAGDWSGRASAIVGSQVMPALGRQIETLKDLQSKASEDAGVWRLPGGADYYAWSLRYYTTTDMTPEQVHEMGRRQVAEISAEIDRILTARGMTQGSVGERLALLGRQADQLYPNDDAGKAALLEDLNKQIEHVSALLPAYFKTLPKAGVEVKRVPELTEAGAPGGYYMTPSLDGTRPGAYYINLRDTAEWPRWTLPTLTYHEASPGHHFQLALQQESTRIPVLRQVMGYSAFTEGWGLYAEQLADEMGAYRDDPLGRVGYLQSLLFRATRLVVDTGIHHKRWTKDQAVRFMVDTLGDQESSVVGEVERYVANPGQATSYKVGHTKIAELRRQAEARLGKGFDIASFHDTVLLAGAMPLSVLEQLVDEWTKARLRP